MLSREDQVGTGERAARLGMVQALRNSGRLSEAASDKVVKTIYRSADPNVSAPEAALSAPASGSHPSNWSTWAENQPAAPPLTPGCVLRDRFVLEEVIGTGGMSVVFRALDRRREEAQDRHPHVAIKVLGDEFKRHPDALRALQRESRKTQRLAHPNIASVYDFDRDGPNVYMVMELLVGEPLDVLLRRRGFLGLKKIEALRILSEMGAALSHAHGFGIVHSDFKPSNAFVTLSGETKVIDFGVSRATKPRSAEGQTVLTMFDAGKLGALTAAYCSPEQMLGDADPDPSDDVYALGVVAYELLSGRHPFGGRSALDAQLKGLSVEPIEGLGDEQNAALRAALECRREHRTGSVVELLQGLDIHPAPVARGAGRPRTTPHELPHVPRDGTRLRARAPSAVSGHPKPEPPAVSPWRRRALYTALLVVVSGAAFYGFQQWQMRANEALDAAATRDRGCRARPPDGGGADRAGTSGAAEGRRGAPCGGSRASAGGGESARQGREGPGRRRGELFSAGWVRCFNRVAAGNCGGGSGAGFRFGCSSSADQRNVRPGLDRRHRSAGAGFDRSDERCGGSDRQAHPLSLAG